MTYRDGVHFQSCTLRKKWAGTICPDPFTAMYVRGFEEIQKIKNITKSSISRVSALKCTEVEQVAHKYQLNRFLHHHRIPFEPIVKVMVLVPP